MFTECLIISYFGVIQLEEELRKEKIYHRMLAFNNIIIFVHGEELSPRVTKGHHHIHHKQKQE